MINALKKEGHQIKEKYPGIYYITGNIPVAAQIVVTSKLSPKNHSSLRILSKNAKQQDIETFLQNSRHESNPEMRNNIDAVLQASMSANYKKYEEIRRSNIMCQALEELMKDVIDQKVLEGEIKGKIDAKIEAVKNIIESLNLSAEQAMDALKIPVNERADILKRL